MKKQLVLDFLQCNVRVGTIKKAEVLVLGGVIEQGDRTLLQPDIDIPNGTPIS